MLKKLLDTKCIALDLKSNDKKSIINELVDLLFVAGKLNDKNKFKEEILKREAQSSTGLEDGIAIPHGKCSAVKTPAIAIGISKKGIDYDSIDGEKSKLFFMIAAPENATNSHIETLSSLTKLFSDEDMLKKIFGASSPEEIIKTLTSGKAGSTGEVEEDYDILAVTACPTGIAHTYIAAESLLKKAKEMGAKIKVETNGSTGAKNILTADEIKKAKGIIIVADKNVDMNRFDQKNVEIVPVKEGIKNPERLIKNALNQSAPVYTSSEKSSSTSTQRKGFYKHLMSGVSNMLPFVVGGGILIAICFSFGIKAFDQADPSFNKFAKILMDIGGGNAFFLMVPVLAGFIGMGIADRPGFAPAMVGGLIAVNNGGGFLGGMIAGFLGGYSIVFIKKLFSHMSEKLDALKPVLIYPLLGIFITGVLMYTVIIVPVATLNSWMTNFLNGLGTGNLIFLGIVLGGMMAVDMGGPINKAAFTFGIAAISVGNYYPHAAVMAGGMVPPLAIALATTVFKNKFDKNERQAGKINYIMGASFITEGAIPFAAADPIRIIPACIIGSGIAGGLTMLFGCTLPAPHGGLFVIPIIKHPIMYIVALLIGTIISAVIIGLSKPLKKL